MGPNDHFPLRQVPAGDDDSCIHQLELNIYFYEYKSHDSLRAWVLSTPCGNISTSLKKTICSMEGIIDNKNTQIKDRRDKLNAANYI